jgi:ribosomal protein S18 acetylase RimI-like enzyme
LFGNKNMIRAATVEDAKALALLNDAVWRMHATANPLYFNQPADPSRMTSWFAEILGRASTIAFVATDQGEVVGYAFAEIMTKVESTVTRGRRYLMIHHVAIAPAHRRHGFGRGLLKRCLSEARIQDATHAELGVWAFNESAREFFCRCGFAEMWRQMGMDLKNEDNEQSSPLVRLSRDDKQM